MIWKWDKLNIGTPAWTRKKDQEIEFLSAEFTAERLKVNKLTLAMRNDRIAWDDLMVEHEKLKRELALVTLAEAYRTKERDILLAGGLIETQLGEIENPLGVVVEELEHALGVANRVGDDLNRHLRDLGARINWALRQHEGVTPAGRCTKCNVAAPCKTVRVLLGDESTTS